MTADLIEQVQQAAAAGESLRIVGGDSKRFLGHDLSALEPISTQGLNRLVSYEPSELVVQVEAGYPVKDLVALLDAENQMLGFDPTDFGASTIGGVLASGLSGSRRPFRGAGRDFLLGANLIDGKGDLLQFGGQVMKNVAGYDVSRLLAGSLGCLGLITELSFKVLPKPEQELTASRIVAKDTVLKQMSRLSLLPETTGLAYWQGHLYVRFTGSESSVNQCLQTFDGDVVANDLWQQIDRHELFSDAETLWRVSTEANDSGKSFTEAALIDWGGAQRWLTGTRPDVTEGSVTCYKHAGNETALFSPLPPYQLAIHKKLKQAFDPRGVFNPGKMYPDF